jgi:hypothetical protein
MWRRASLFDVLNPDAVLLCVAVVRMSIQRPALGELGRLTTTTESASRTVRRIVCTGSVRK